MNYIDNLIDEGEWVGLIFVAAVLGYVGLMMVTSRPKLKSWGMRIAAANFLFFSLVRAFSDGAPTTFDLVAAVFHGAIAVGLVLGPAWMVLASASFFYDQFEKAISDQPRCSRSQKGDDQAANETEQRRVIDEQKRRTDARAKVQRAFHLLRNELGDRFTDKEFTEYVGSYLSDDQSPEDVEYHATKLIHLLKQLTEEAGGGGESNTALNQRFERQRAAILAAPVDDDVKDVLLLELEEQFEEQMRNLIRRNRP